jgi:hypothetical protein
MAQAEPGGSPQRQAYTHSDPLPVRGPSNSFGMPPCTPPRSNTNTAGRVSPSFSGGTTPTTAPLSNGYANGLPQPRNLMEGWLTKQAVSATYFKNWRRRWITLTPQCITWHRAGPPFTAPPAGSLEIMQGTHLAFSDARRHCISIRTGTRELLLEARDAREMQRW